MQVLPIYRRKRKYITAYVIAVGIAAEANGGWNCFKSLLTISRKSL